MHERYDDRPWVSCNRTFLRREEREMIEMPADIQSKRLHDLLFGTLLQEQFHQTMELSRAEEV
jgi:hypothetical protein